MYHGECENEDGAEDKITDSDHRSVMKMMWMCVELQHVSVSFIKGFFKDSVLQYYCLYCLLVNIWVFNVVYTLSVTFFLIMDKLQTYKNVLTTCCETENKLTKTKLKTEYLPNKGKREKSNIQVFVTKQESVDVVGRPSFAQFKSCVHPPSFII